MRALRHLLSVVLALALLGDAGASNNDIALAPEYIEHGDEDASDTSGSRSNAARGAVLSLTVAACCVGGFVGLQNKNDKKAAAATARKEAARKEEEEAAAAEDLRATYYALGEEGFPSPYDLRPLSEKALKKGGPQQEDDDSASQTSSCSTSSFDSAEEAEDDEDKKAARAAARRAAIAAASRKKLAEWRELQAQLAEPYSPKVEQLYYHEGVLVDPTTFEVLGKVANAKPWMKLEPGAESTTTIVKPKSSRIGQKFARRAKHRRHADLLRSMRRGKMLNEENVVGLYLPPAVAAAPQLPPTADTPTRSKLSATAAPFVYAS